MLWQNTAVFCTQEGSADWLSSARDRLTPIGSATKSGHSSSRTSPSKWTTGHRLCKPTKSRSSAAVRSEATRNERGRRLLLSFHVNMLGHVMDKKAGLNPRDISSRDGKPRNIWAFLRCNFIWRPGDNEAFGVCLMGRIV